MIRYVTAETLPHLLSFCRRGPFGCKIVSLALAYGLETTFAGFWIQTDSSGTVTAAISKLEHSAVLCAGENIDAEELREFLPMAGIKILLYSPETAFIPRMNRISSGFVMRLAAPVICPLSAFSIVYNPPLRKIHSLLCVCAKDGFQPPPFEFFYVDMSHRIRHQLARSVGILDAGELSCCACTVAETDHCAVLGAVATRPSRRGEGLGSAVVASIIGQLQGEGKGVFLFRAQGENRRFYEQLGFSDLCGWEEAAV